MIQEAASGLRRSVFRKWGYTALTMGFSVWAALGFNVWVSRTVVGSKICSTPAQQQRLTLPVIRMYHIPELRILKALKDFVAQPKVFRGT